MNNRIWLAAFIFLPLIMNGQLTESEGTIRISSSLPELQLYDNKAGEERIEMKIRESNDDIIIDHFEGDLRFRNDLIKYENSSGLSLINHKIQNLNSIYSGEIELFANGSRTIKIDGLSSNGTLSSGSAMTFYDHQAKEGVKIRGVSGHGQIELLNDNFDGTDKSAILLQADGSNNEPFIRLDKKDGRPAILLDSHWTEDQPEIVLYNNDFQTDSDSVAIRIAAAGSNDEPFIQLRRKDGTNGIILDVDVSGDSRITTDELKIEGGSDFAETFDILPSKLESEPGMIVSIDPHSSGKLTISTEPYDKKVAGIISGANGVETGLFMGQKGSIADGDYPVALSGRVYVYANEDGGKIKPGDLLTTSSKSGYAMKAKNHRKAQGAVIGKAMTEIDENGFVLVLVNLQ